MSQSWLPEPFISRMHAILQQEWYESVISTFSHEKVTAFRLNRMNGGSRECLSHLEDEGINPEPVEGFDDVWTVERTQRDSLLRSREFEGGKYTSKTFRV